MQNTHMTPLFMPLLRRFANEKIMEKIPEKRSLA